VVDAYHSNPLLQSRAASNHQILPSRTLGRSQLKLQHTLFLAADGISTVAFIRCKAGAMLPGNLYPPACHQGSWLAVGTTTSPSCLVSDMLLVATSAKSSSAVAAYSFGFAFVICMRRSKQQSADCIAHACSDMALIAASSTVLRKVLRRGACRTVLGLRGML
jgi:hypothetical protein